MNFPVQQYFTFIIVVEVESALRSFSILEFKFQNPFLQLADFVFC